MSHAGSTASSVKRHVGNSLSQWSEHSDIPSDVSQHSLSSHHHHHHSYETEWDAREELRLRELEEARARAAQMEKTMRWWSDCTANWREKWSKVRTERNKAREESRVLRGKLEVAAKECNTLKREKQELYCQIERLKKESQIFNGKSDYIDEKKDDLLLYSGNQISERVVAERDVGPGEKVSDSDSFTHSSSKIFSPETLDNDNSEVSSTIVEASDPSQTTNQDLQFLDKLLQRDCKESITISTIPTVSEKKCSRLSHRGLEDFNVPVQDLTEQKVAMLQLRLDEATKTIIAERQEKNKLMKTIEKLQGECNQIRMKYEDLKKSKQDTLKELSQIKAEHQDEIDNMRLDLEDEANSRSTLDQRLAELRTEELADLKHAHTKLKKVLQDKSTELAHALRRSEQYEAEVKKLRGRIEELKKELASAEDEVDSATNNIRKLQRTNDEFQEQIESLQVQVEHLQTRQEKDPSAISLTQELSQSCPSDPPC